MGFSIRIYQQDRIMDFSLAGRDRFSIGGSSRDDVFADFLEKSGGSNSQNTEQSFGGGGAADYLLFSKVNEIWYVNCKNHEILGYERMLQDGDIFALSKENKFSVFVYEEKVEETRVVPLKELSQLIIGHSEKCGLVLNEKTISTYHAVVYRVGDRFAVSDSNSTNGTYYNRRRLLQPVYLSDGDVISIGRYNIVYKSQVLTVKSMADIAPEEKQTDYPYWYEPAPRLLKKLPDDEVNIDPCPPSIKGAEFNLFQLGMSAASTAFMMSPLAFLSLGGQIGNTEISKKKAKQYEELRQKKYGEYLDKKEKEIDDLREKQHSWMDERDPGLNKLSKILNEMSAGLWNRRMGEPDFMNIRIGSGEGDISFSINGPKECFVLVEDELEERAKKIVKDSLKIKDVPVTCDMRNDHLIGIVGERDSVKKLAKNMILNAAAQHSYEDLKIVVVYDKKEEKDFSWIRWLPHSFNEGRDSRFIGSTASSVAEILGKLKDFFEKRVREAEKNTSTQGTCGMFSPYFLFVFAQVELAKNQEILNLLQRQTELFDLGASVLYLYDRMSQLPLECQTIIQAEEDKGTIFHKGDINSAKEFIYDEMDEDYESFARKMAPLKLALRKDEASLPACVTFLDGYHVKYPEELKVGNRWADTKPHKSLAVPVGVNADGVPFMFDIHEKKHGVHGLVAGTTGSGKSEMVQSWILSMALHFPPEEVSFVLIDFKGTGLIRPFRELPHLAGTISNLDKTIHRNLIALRHELIRRQELLDACKEKTGVEVKEIPDYLELYKKGLIKEPMPYLIIVIDEFAEFKVQFPDFMAEIESVFKIGRGLGVFAILLTQAPGGVVTAQMDKNMKFRWCLKVGSPADSNEVMHHPDAARISVPGRSYVRVGNDEVYELIQSYYSGAKYRPDVDTKGQYNTDVSIVEENGKRIKYKEEKKEQDNGNERTQISVVVEYLHDYVEKNGIAKASQVWLPKIPYRIPLEKCAASRYNNGIWEHIKGEDIAPVVGMVDNPAAQQQYPLRINFTREGHLVIYGAPSTGKTTFLQTAIMSLIRTYSPEDVNIYIMDFGGWNLGIFKDYPHIGGIANDNEEEKIYKLVQFIDRQMELRKEMFSAEGVGSLPVYEQATGKHLPVILLALDNFGPVLQLYPKLDQFFMKLTQQGGNYGIYFLVSANSPAALGFRIYQNIKMAMSLNMSDKGDYSSIVGRTDGLEPENTEGRGLLKGKPVLEFQTALPMNAENEGLMIQKIRELGTEIKRSYKGRRAAAIPIMPDIVYRENVPENAVGLSVQHIEPVIMPEDTMHYMLVAGPDQSGKTNMLKNLAKIWLDRGASEVTYADLKHTSSDLEEVEGLNYISDAEALDLFVEGMVPELQRRSEEKKAGKTKFDDRIILIDDYDIALSSMDEQTHKRLEAIIRLGEGLHVYLIIACGADDFNRFANQGEMICGHLKNSDIIFLTGGNIRSYTTIRTDADPQLKSYDLAKNEIFMICQKNIVLCKAVYGG